MAFFYDTNVLLQKQENLFEKEIIKEKFYISIVTLQELESIKTSSHKDEEIKYKARKILHLLDKNEDMYEVVLYNTEWDNEITSNYGFQINNDMKIIYTAFKIHPEAIFVTNDLSCKQLAKNLGLIVQGTAETIDSYTGYMELKVDNEELAEFYGDILNNNKNIYNLLENQYLIVSTGNQIVDSYKWKDNKYIKINYHKFESKMFGKITPQDEYQKLAMDSLINNQLTVIRGLPGSGKSYLGLGYLITKLERGDIDRIIIFCNPVATRDSCKLGFYPGDKNTKLLDSQIGNFLIGKFGDIYIVEELINKGKLILVPVADCRGMDISGMNAGVYFSEAQNSTIDMMKLMLQRCGDDSLVVIEGDDKTQIDAISYAGNNNGLKKLSEVFRGQPYYGEVTLAKCHRGKIAEQAEKMI